MSDAALRALSPLDGRYADQVEPLRDCFSEFALIRARAEVQANWLMHLAAEPGITELPAFSKKQRDWLTKRITDFNLADAKQVKKTEQTTKHDVKAVEYFWRDQLPDTDDWQAAKHFIHFACTSEDVTNLAWGLLLRRAREQVLLPALAGVRKTLADFAAEHAYQPMLARTHGQPASPTTLGKEFANVVARLDYVAGDLAAQPIHGKLNGATGNFNAHLAAYPDLDWPDIARRFVESLDLKYLPLTTQIEPHDGLAALMHAQLRCNSVLLDLARDLWGYIALDYFRLKTKPGEVGSSVMPHKVNPIQFENAEGNFGLANALLEHLAAKLPVSRWQRDLSDSTVLRNVGAGFGHSLLGINSIGRGLDQLAVDPDRLAADLTANWAVLGEAVQTALRRYGEPGGYEALRDRLRGASGDMQPVIQQFIHDSNLPDEVKQRLLKMTPADYTGNAAKAARGLKDI